MLTISLGTKANLDEKACKMRIATWAAANIVSQT